MIYIYAIIYIYIRTGTTHYNHNLLYFCKRFIYTLIILILIEFPAIGIENQIAE